MDRLRCPTCETTFPVTPEEPWRCPPGHPLEFDDPPRPTGDPPVVGADDRTRGLWAFEGLVPGPGTVTLGEGWTPLVGSPDWGATFKLEYVSPTRSFKDRGAAVTIDRAAALGVDRVLDDSSGNAGVAIATYAAHAGLDARIYVPASSASTKRERIAATGAEVVEVAGPRSAATAACHDAVEDGAGWYASHAWHPAFYAGTATFAYELAAQSGWTAPDAVVIPVGHGTLLLGVARAFQAMAAADWIEGVPRLLAVQAAGTAPLVRTIRGSNAGAGENTIASGVQIEAPARFEQVQTAVATSGGDAIAVNGTRTERALTRLRSQGFDVEPTAALAPAGLTKYRTEEVIGEDDDVVVPLTGAGIRP